MVTVQMKRLHDEAILPERATELASGYDLYALDVVRPDKLGQDYQEDARLWAVFPFERVLVRTGVALAMPEGLEAQVRPRSGLALKKGLHIYLGTIDADYRGDVGVILQNLSEETLTIRRGDRIAQLVFAPVVHRLAVELTTDLKESSRGEGGFGSTGISKEEP